MCLTPITIKNPYFGLGHLGVNYLRDTSSITIQVPCGSCPSCIALKQMFILQRVQMESLRSHIFMFTLTYNDSSLRRVRVGEYNIPVPVFSDVQNMFKRLRSKGYKFRYLVCSEYGRLHFRPHFHGLLAVEKSDEHFSVIERRFARLLRSEWRVNYGSKRVPIYSRLSTDIYKNGRNTTFDFHYVEPVRGHENDVSYYVTKYVTKFDSRTKKLLQKIACDTALSPDDTTFLLSSIKPFRTMSKDFGDFAYPLIQSTITAMSSRKSDYRYPQYYDIFTGQQMPMSPYYGKRLSNFAHCYRIFEKFSSLADINSNLKIDDRSLREISSSREDDIKKISEFSKKMKKVFERSNI